MTKLLAIVLFSTLVACGGSKKPAPAAPAPEATPAAPEESEKKADEAAPDEPKADPDEGGESK